jgi:hypothetical protein
MVTFPALTAALLTAAADVLAVVGLGVGLGVLPPGGSAQQFRGVGLGPTQRCGKRRGQLVGLRRLSESSEDRRRRTSVRVW